MLNINIPKGLMDIKGCPMDSFQTALPHACPSLTFVSKGIMNNKEYPVDTLTLPLVLIVHPLLSYLRD